MAVIPFPSRQTPYFPNAKAVIDFARSMNNVGILTEQHRLEPQITDAMLDEWRKQQAWTAWKYSMTDAKCQMPTQSSSGRSHCFCGEEITIAGVSDHVYAEHMGTKQAAIA